MAQLTDLRPLRADVPGRALGVLHEGRVETTAFGVASVETGLPLRADAVFRIASLTKPFTATLALAFGLDLDAPVAPGEAITLRDVLSHRSGLDCELPGGLDGLGSLANVAEAACREVPRWAQPGELWAYSNAGYWLAGAAIERATGQTFEATLREHVLAPLGLTATTFDVEDAILRPAAVGHADGAVVPGCYWFPRVRRPSGGLISTVADVLTFAALHFDGRFAALREPQIEAVGCSWGLGWKIEDAGGTRVVSHTGGYAGFATILVVVPERKFAFCACANGEAGDAENRRLALEALERWLGLRLPKQEQVELPDDALRSLAGTYCGSELEVRVSAAEGRGLSLEVAAFDVSTGRWRRQESLTAVPVSTSSFAFAGADEQFDFPRAGLLRISGRLAERR